MPIGLDYDPEQLAEICRRYRVAKLELFGSRARGDARPESDVDLLVTFGQDCTPGLEFIELADAMEDLFGRPIDLLVREDAELDRNLIRRRSILHVVEPLYAA